MRSSLARQMWGLALAVVVLALPALGVFPTTLYTWTAAAKRCAAIGGGGTIWATCSVDGDCGTGAPAGACIATIVPTDYDELANEVEAVESFLGVDGKNITIHPYVPYCLVIENLAAADDNTLMAAWPVTAKVEDVSCHCQGTCTSPAQLTFESDDDAAIGSAVTCSSGGSDMAWTDVSGDADAALAAGERLRFDVTNTPNPDATDDYLVCATASKQ